MNEIILFIAGEVASFLLSQGLDVNKMDKFGRTPLYYFLASFNSCVNSNILTVLLEAGAKLTVPREDTHFSYFGKRSTIYYRVLIFIEVLVKSSNIACTDSVINDNMRLLVTPLLQSDVNPDEDKWCALLMIFDRVLNVGLVSKDESKVTSIFSYLYYLIHDICSDLGIRCELFIRECHEKIIFKSALKYVEVLKFLISKGVDMNKTCIEGQDNFLDYAIRTNNFESVKFLVRIGVRPKNALTLLTNENNQINSRVRKIVKETYSKLSLKNISRLMVNKSLNVDKTFKFVPREVGEFIRFERFK